MKTNIRFFGLFLLLIFSADCSNDGQPAGFDYGKVENNKYINSFFDFEMSIPIGWSVQLREQTEKLSKIEKDYSAGDDEKIKAAIDVAHINSASLLAVFKHDLKTTVQYNPNMMMVAENLKNAPDVKTGADYLAHTRYFLKQSQMKHDYIDDASKKEIIGGKEFYLMNVTINYNGMQIYQTYYSTIQKGFCLIATISYIDNIQKKVLQDAIKSITFK